MRPTVLIRKFAGVKDILRLFILPFAVCAVLSTLLPSRSLAQFGGDTAIMVCGGMDTMLVGEAYFRGGQLANTLHVLVDFDSTFKSDTIRARFSGDSSVVVHSFDTIHISTGKPTYLSFTVQYVPKQIRVDTFQILLTRSNGKCKYEIKLTAYGIDTTSEKTPVFLGARRSSTVAFVSSRDTSVRYLKLYNNFSDSLRIDSMRLFKAVSFQIDTVLKYPIILASQGTLQLPLAFEPAQTGLNQEYLIVSVPDNPILQDVIPIQGFFDPPSQSVRINVARMAHFVAYPNPAHGDITIHADALNRSHVEIIDMLGRPIQASAFDKDWQGYLTSLPSGAYFLIVSGTTETGEPIREVQSIVLE